MNILILDDKMLLVKDTIRDINKILPDAECFGFHRESDALSFAETHPIDVALLRLRVNIIFLTAYPEYALDSYKVYCSDFLVKPLNRSQLKKSFENLRYPIRSSIASSSKGKYNISVLGSKIKQNRNAQGLTAEALAERLDVSVQTIYRWESGERKPDSANLVRLANTLGIGLDELISEK